MSREAVRDALVDLLTVNLIGPNMAQTVTGHKLSDMVGLAPVVLVRSMGTDRTRMTFEDDRPIFDLDVVIYTHQAKGAWTEAMACDMVDRLESLLADVIEANRCGPIWDTIQYREASKVEEITQGTGGNRYYMETFPIQVYTC